MSKRHNQNFTHSKKINRINPKCNKSDILKNDILQEYCYENRYKNYIWDFDTTPKMWLLARTHIPVLKLKIGNLTLIMHLGPGIRRWPTGDLVVWVSAPLHKGSSFLTITARCFIVVGARRDLHHLSSIFCMATTLLYRIPTQRFIIVVRQ